MTICSAVGSGTMLSSGTVTVWFEIPAFKSYVVSVYKHSLYAGFRFKPQLERSGLQEIEDQAVSVRCPEVRARFKIA